MHAPLGFPFAAAFVAIGGLLWFWGLADVVGARFM
jgi:hypothetical protein